MRKRYSKEFKETIIKKMVSPHAVSVSQLCRETGVSDVTLYKWRKEYQNRGVAVPSNKKKSQDWTAEDKLAVVIETASLNEFQLMHTASSHPFDEFNEFCYCIKFVQIIAIATVTRIRCSNCHIEHKIL